MNSSVDPRPVAIRFTAVDKEKRFVNNLGKSDFSLAEEGTRQEIADLKVQTNAPASFAVLLDNSASMESFLPLVKLASQIFIKGFVRPDHDQAAVLSVAGHVSIEQQITDDIKQLHEAIENVKFVPPPGYPDKGTVSSHPNAKAAQLQVSTGLWDAISFTCETLSPARSGSRKAIIVFTDGVDTSSRMLLSDAIEQAIRHDVAVFAIAIGDEKNFGIDTEVLKKLTERTGGRFFFPKKTDEFEMVFSHIDRELRAHYVLTFRSNLGNSKGKYRRLKIEVTNPERKMEKIHLAYKQGYFPENKAR